MHQSPVRTRPQDLPQQPPSDVDLVAAVLAGDEQAFSQLYERYHARVLRFAMKRMANSQDAEDVTQEVFLQVHLSLHRFEGRSRFLTWVFGIAHHRVCRFHRGKQLALTSLDDQRAETLASEQADVDRVVDASRVFARFERVVETHLSPAQREAIGMGCRQARSSADAARSAGRSPGAMKGRAFRARRVLLEKTDGLEALLASG